MNTATESPLALAIAKAKAENPDPKQCWRAMRGIKWRMKAQDAPLWACKEGRGIGMTSDISKALLFDARDNEEMKLRYYRAVTGEELEAELA